METRLEIHKNILSLISHSFFKKEGFFVSSYAAALSDNENKNHHHHKPCACHASAVPEMQMVIEENPQSEKKAENPTRACK